MPVTTIEREVTRIPKEKTREKYEERYKKAKKEFLNKVIKKKTKQLVKPISSTRLVKSFAKTEYGHINPAPERTYTNDNRSIFFKSEFNKEKRNMGGGWL